MTRVIVITALAATCVACGNDAGDRPAPPAGPTPTSRAAAVIVVENFLATEAPAIVGQVTYTVSLTLRETAGIAATLSGVTLTLTTTSGSTLSRDYSPAEAFGTNRITANGTLQSGSFSLTGPPLMPQSLAARVTFTDDNGNAGAAQGSTLVRTTGS